LWAESKTGSVRDITSLDPSGQDVGMAAQFCTKCGSSLPSGSAFCTRCGTPVAGTSPPPLDLSPAPSPPTVGTSVGGALPSLDAALGLRGKRSFLVQHQLLSLGHSYRVMDSEKRHLFTVQGNAGQNISGNMLGGLVGGSDSYLGRMMARSVEMTYTLTDAQGTVYGTVAKQGGANQSSFTLVDSGGQPHVVVNMERSVIGGIKAVAVDPNGQPMLSTSGNLMRHNFMIRDPQGHDLAKVHEAWVAVRDTYNVDMLGEMNPLYPLVFTIMLDFEKEK